MEIVIDGDVGDVNIVRRAVEKGFYVGDRGSQRYGLLRDPSRLTSSAALQQMTRQDGSRSPREIRALHCIT